MKIIVDAKELFPNVRAAFEKREAFTLTGAGVTAKFVADELTYSPTGFSGVRLSMELTLAQVSEATCSETWDGEGLPPVGSICEINHPKLGWVRCDIVAHKVMDCGGNTRAIAWIDGDTLDQSQGIRLRPLRTAEQIAEEKREAALKEMLAVTGGSSRRAAKALYDAGYRKP